MELNVESHSVQLLNDDTNSRVVTLLSSLLWLCVCVCDTVATPSSDETADAVVTEAGLRQQLHQKH